jgi:hypothetical protein
MPLSRFLAKGLLEPAQVKRLNEAYMFALLSPDLVNRRDDPIVDIVAKKIIEIAILSDIRDAREICDTALRQPGLKPRQVLRGESADRS